MRDDYYLPTFFNDYYKWVRKCEKCVFFLGKQILVALPLHPTLSNHLFYQWGLDFIGPIKPPSSSSHKWILVAIDYFKIWIEVVALRDATNALVVEFLDGIVTRFGVP